MIEEFSCDVAAWPLCLKTPDFRETLSGTGSLRIESVAVSRMTLETISGHTTSLIRREAAPGSRDDLSK